MANSRDKLGRALLVVKQEIMDKNEYIRRRYPHLNDNEKAIMFESIKNQKELSVPGPFTGKKVNGEKIISEKMGFDDIY